MNETTEVQAAVTLGGTLGEVLRTAIGDMDDRLASGRYRAAGRSWHTPDGGPGHEETCHVCLAGATFARFGVKHRERMPESRRFGDSLGAIMALEKLRVGDIAGAAMEFYGTRAALGAAMATQIEEATRLWSAHGVHTLAHQDLQPWNGEDGARAHYEELAEVLEATGV